MNADKRTNEDPIEQLRVDYADLVRELTDELDLEAGLADALKRVKRDECGCHRECTVADELLGVPPHACDVPCRWPSCLTEDEANEVAREVEP